MHEHRTIPQRLHDHDLDIEDLRDRVIALENALGLGGEPPIEDVDTKGKT
jgi:hypothetical protein